MELCVQDLAVSMRNTPIVQDVSLHAGSREVIGIIGPNGSGKSTLLKAIYRVLKPSGGAVLLDGRALSSMSLRESAQLLGVMAQTNEFSFDFSVEKMVRMGRTPYKGLLERDNAEDDRLVAEAMEQTGITALRERSFSTLSGGEKQRVLIARALAQQTEVLILDEPTNHLDIQYQLQLMELVKSCGRTVVAAIHDLNLAAAYCDRLYAMKGGRIAGSGTPRELLTPSFLRELYQVEAEVSDGADGGIRIFFRAAGT